MEMRLHLVMAICAAAISVTALSSPTYAQQKTVKACEDEWRAKRAENQKAGITEKAYVEKCRAESGVATPRVKPRQLPLHRPLRRLRSRRSQPQHQAQQRPRKHPPRLQPQPRRRKRPPLLQRPRRPALTNSRPKAQRSHTARLIRSFGSIRARRSSTSRAAKTMERPRLALTCARRIPSRQVTVRQKMKSNPEGE